MLTRREAKKAATKPEPAKPEYTDEQLDIMALRAYLAAEKRIKPDYSREQRKQVIMPIIDAVRPLFGDDSAGFRTFLIECHLSEIPPDAQNLLKAAKIYLTR